MGLWLILRTNPTCVNLSQTFSWVRNRCHYHWTYICCSLPLHWFLNHFLSLSISRIEFFLRRFLSFLCLGTDFGIWESTFDESKTCQQAPFCCCCFSPLPSSVFEQLFLLFPVISDSIRFSVFPSFFSDVFSFFSFFFCFCVSTHGLTFLGVCVSPFHDYIFLIITAVMAEINVRISFNGHLVWNKQLNFK